MRPKIKLRPVIKTRPRIVIKAPANHREQLRKILNTVTSPKQIDMLKYLVQRYGVVRVRDLPTDRVQAFTEELREVLAGKLPHPADSNLTPFYQRKENQK